MFKKLTKNLSRKNKQTTDWTAVKHASKRPIRIPGNLKLFLLSLIATGLVVLPSCKKEEKNCPDAAYYANLKKNKPTKAEWLKDNPQVQLKSAAENDCDTEKTAVEQGVSDSTAYATDVRAGFLAMPPQDDPLYGYYYWAAFRFQLPDDPDLIDSTLAHIKVANIWWEEFGDPFPLPEADSLLRALYNIGGTYLTQCDTMPILRKALYDCETYVGIDELEWEDLNNECGEGRWVQKVNSPEKTAVTEEVIQRTQGR